MKLCINREINKKQQSVLYVKSATSSLIMRSRKSQSLCSGPPLSHLNICMHHVDSNTVLRADAYEFRYLLPQIEGSTLLQLAIISCSLIKPETNLRLTNSTGNAYVVCLDFDLAGLKERIGDWKTFDREPPHR